MYFVAPKDTTRFRGVGCTEDIFGQSMSFGDPVRASGHLNSRVSLDLRNPAEVRSAESIDEALSPKVAKLLHAGLGRPTR